MPFADLLNVSRPSFAFCSTFPIESGQIMLFMFKCVTMFDLHKYEMYFLLKSVTRFGIHNDMCNCDFM